MNIIYERPIIDPGRPTEQNIAVIGQWIADTADKLNFERRNKSEGEDLEEYDGSYFIVPRITRQVLETEGRKMREDMTIKEIPTYETSNAYGTTFIIGE